MKREKKVILPLLLARRKEDNKNSCFSSASCIPDGRGMQNNRLLSLLNEQLSRHLPNTWEYTHAHAHTHTHTRNFHMMSHHRKALTGQDKIRSPPHFTEIAQVSILNGNSLCRDGTALYRSRPILSRSKCNIWQLYESVLSFYGADSRYRWYVY